MALFTCPECGKLISDKAESCPNCGFPIGSIHTEKTVLTKECPNCGAIVDVNQAICNNCGYDFIKEQKYGSSFEEHEYEIATKEKQVKAAKDKKILIAVAVAVFAIFVVAISIIRNTSPLVGRWQLQDNIISEMGVVQYEFTRNGYFKSYLGSDENHLFPSGIKYKYDATKTTVTLHKEEGDIQNDYRIEGNTLYWGDSICIRIAN